MSSIAGRRRSTPEQTGIIRPDPQIIGKRPDQMGIRNPAGASMP
jgi:hypothetical protein